MKNKLYGKAFLPILVSFLVTAGLIFLGASILRGLDVDTRVLLGGDELLFALTGISYLLHIRSLRSSNPHAFVRMVYSSLIVKMFACMIAAFLYGSFSKTINRNAIIGCFILYILYTFLEVKILMKFLKKEPKNA
jgi:hypothetical protein